MSFCVGMSSTFINSLDYLFNDALNTFLLLDILRLKISENRNPVANWKQAQTDCTTDGLSHHCATTSPFILLFTLLMNDYFV